MTLLSIGQFAQLVGLSVSALRFYADSGVLLPAQVDQDSGYRYYTPAQIPLGQQVAALRKLDLPLAELNALLSATPPQVTSILERHERRLLEQFEARRQMLLDVGRVLEGQRTLPAVDAQYRPWPAQQTLSLTMSAEAEGFHASYVHSVAQLVQHAQATDTQVTGGDFGLYHAQEYFSGPLQTEVCVPISRVVAGQGRIRCLQLPAVTVVCALHPGTWHTFSATFGALYLAASQAGHHPGTSYTRSTPDGIELGFFLN